MSRNRRFMHRIISLVCAGVIVAASLSSLSAAATRAEDASAAPVLGVDQRSAQTPNGVVVFDSSGNPILVPGAGGNPQQAPGVG